VEWEWARNPRGGALSLPLFFFFNFNFFKPSEKFQSLSVHPRVRRSAGGAPKISDFYAPTMNFLNYIEELYFFKKFKNIININDLYKND